MARTVRTIRFLQSEVAILDNNILNLDKARHKERRLDPALQHIVQHQQASPSMLPHKTKITRIIDST
jgi:uncharacterized damage-inducible protein DinB